MATFASGCLPSGACPKCLEKGKVAWTKKKLDKSKAPIKRKAKAKAPAKPKAARKRRQVATCLAAPVCTCADTRLVPRLS